MIRIAILIGKDGCLKAFEAEGHAEQGRKGTDIVCAAATALLRTAARLYTTENGVKAESSSDGEGRLWLECGGLAGETRERMKGMTDFLLTGLADLKSDFPENIEFIIERESEE